MPHLPFSKEHSRRLTPTLPSNMICAVAGMTADANILINYARQAAQRHLLTYSEDIPCEQLVRRLCDLKQGYTQHGGLRPFGVSFIYAGYDPQRAFQLYQSNPSGNYGGWKATSVGANNASAQSLLKQDYDESCDLNDACGLAVKVLSKTMDSVKLSSEKSESGPPLRRRYVSTERKSIAKQKKTSRVRHRRQDKVRQGLPPPLGRRRDRRPAQGARPGRHRRRQGARGHSEPRRELIFSIKENTRLCIRTNALQIPWHGADHKWEMSCRIVLGL
ncbi:MAG: hypothetical protein INR71_00945 [Terriglobus roseus]|nr:hypothetical protein [Terriglobus roseus]